MTRHTLRAVASRAALGVALVAVSLAPLAAQAKSKSASLDRRAIPAAGKTPELRVPAWTKATLDNGATLIVSEKHGLSTAATLRRKCVSERTAR